MSIRDRGTKKWTSIMLPEHVDAVKRIWEEEDYKEKPCLDEQKKMEIDANLQCALHNDLLVRIKYYNNGDSITIEGRLLVIDSLNKKLILDDEDIPEISLDNVLDVYFD